MGGKLYTVRKKDLLFPELSFTINGILFDVAKTLGGGHKEKYYQSAIAEGLKNKGVQFREQVYVPLTYLNQKVGTYFLDFLIDDTIVLELKRGEFISTSIIQQTMQYLTALKLKLGILACFTHGGVVIKRVANE